MRRTLLAVCLAAALLAPAAVLAGPPLLLQTPSLSADGIAFAFGGEIWMVPRAGGTAHRVVSGTQRAQRPIFSPDGTKIAYSADYEENLDVYVIDTTGGTPRRLTWHPGDDQAVAWTPDGSRILFRSDRASANDSSHLFTVGMEGGLPEELPLPMAEDGVYSPDGTQLAYSPYFQWEPDWRGYRGGQTTPIWIARLADSSVVKVPRENSNDKNPMWMGDTVYFLSDRGGAMNLYSYGLGEGPDAGDVSQRLPDSPVDIDSAQAGPGGIVYSQMGALHLFDPATGTEHPVPVEIAGDLPQLRPHFEKVGDDVENAAISPTGVRAVFEAHGEILTVPAEKGDVRNLTRTTAAAERDPAWSPDGSRIAYFSDESGEYALHVASQDGLGAVRKIGLGAPPSFFYSPTWSPDSRRIAYSDKRLNLWVVDLDHPAPVKVDTDLFDTPLHELDTVWSPDSRWLAYTKQLPNHLRAVFVYSLDSAKATRVTDGLSDCLYPAFDKSGKYLYFTASTDRGLATGWLDMTSDARPESRSVYVAVLRRDLPSPIPPESDEEATQEEKPDEPGTQQAGGKAKKEAKKAKAEKAGDEPEDAAKPAPEPVTIDFDGILQRTLALPIDPSNYQGLEAGKEGQIFLLDAPLVFLPTSRQPPALSIVRFDLEERETKTLVEGVSGFTVSADGSKMLYQKGPKWWIAKTDAPPAGGPGGGEGGGGPLATDQMEVKVDPRAEWRQMYREVWRIERDFFYDPHFHGLDIAAAEARFAPYLDGLASRGDLNFLFRRMLSYISVGHMFVNGGARPDVEPVKVGLLGADYTTDHGRYRFAKVYNGENWNPDLQAPLTQPGVNVEAGEYLLAVDGRDLTTADNLYSFFQETAGKQTVVTVGPNPDGSGSRQVTVVPVDDENQLRHLDWVESNRRKVDELSGGRLAYVYLPNTGGGGFTNFNRYYFSQVGREGAVIDERFNHGGQIADYVIDAMERRIRMWVMTREGEPFSEPTELIPGPKAMIINQFAGSGGDAMPWLFQREGVGPLVGMRTWGGLVGIGGYPPLMDGGGVTAPRWAIYGLEGEWEVENHGIAPDVEVWQDPKLVREGHDPQLEKAVEVLLEELEKHPQPTYEQPPYPDYHPVLPPPVAAEGGDGPTGG